MLLELLKCVQCGHKTNKLINGNNSDRWDNTLQLAMHILIHIASYSLSAVFSFYLTMAQILDILAPTASQTRHSTLL